MYINYSENAIINDFREIMCALESYLSQKQNCGSHTICVAVQNPKAIQKVYFSGKLLPTHLYNTYMVLSNSFNSTMHCIKHALEKVCSIFNGDFILGCIDQGTLQLMVRKIQMHNVDGSIKFILPICMLFE